MFRLGCGFCPVTGGAFSCAVRMRGMEPNKPKIDWEKRATLALLVAALVPLALWILMALAIFADGNLSSRD